MNTPSKTIDLTDKLLEKQQKGKPQIGRYSISQLWGVLNGFSTPKEWLKGEKIDFQNALRMRMGTLKHELVQELLEDDWQIEKKAELLYKDFILVGKADGIKGDTIMEIKTSDLIIPQAKKWHIWQLKMYLSMFNKEKGVIYQPVVQKSRLYLKEIGVVKQDKKWFKEQLELINHFHLEIKNVSQKNQKAEIKK